MTTGMSSLTDLAVANGESLSWGKRTYVMGVINVTPDSFSGDGLSGDVQAAVEQALRFEGEGADFLDIGAESTRPGHQPVAEAEELARLINTAAGGGGGAGLGSHQRGHLEVGSG